jgi:hypothetical protein
MQRDLRALRGDGGREVCVLRAEGGDLRFGLAAPGGDGAGAQCESAKREDQQISLYIQDFLLSG